MKCKNCGLSKGEHYVEVKKPRGKKLKNVYLWCYPLRKSIKPEHKEYFMQYEDSRSVQEASK